MSRASDFLGLYGAILWRLWIEQRRTIFVFPALMAALFAVVLLGTRFAPGLLTGPTLDALHAAAAGQDTGGPGAVGSLARAFVEHQAPFLLALLAGLSADAVSSGLVSDDSDRGSLELLLATRHDVGAIGGAIPLAAWSISAVSWALLVGLSFLLTQSFNAWLHLHVSMAVGDLTVAVAMQLVLTLLAAELTVIVTLLFPGLRRIRTGVTADPTTLIAALPALLAFVAVNVAPEVSLLRLSLAALMFAGGLLVLGAASLRMWFRPEQFLES